MVNWEQVINEMELPELRAEKGNGPGFIVPGCPECGGGRWTLLRAVALTDIARIECQSCGRQFRLVAGMPPAPPISMSLDNDML